MQITKEDKNWLVCIDRSDNQMGMVNMLRNMEKLDADIQENPIEELILKIDLGQLERANSELIAQFVMLQSSLVRNNGRLQLINANYELKSTFDVVMLDKIINIQYMGQDENAVDDSDYYEEE